jgi:hypothetical protein
MIAGLLLVASLSLVQLGPGAPPFAVASPQGLTVQGSALLAGGRRVVIYVSPDIEPAARLVEALRRWQASDPARWQERVSVIVAAPAAEARAWLAAHWGDGELPTWFADPDAAAWHALGFQGSLGVAGASRGIVEWKLDGVINDPAVLESAVRVWVEGEAP